MPKFEPTIKQLHATEAPRRRSLLLALESVGGYVLKLSRQEAVGVDELGEALGQVRICLKLGELLRVAVVRVREETVEAPRQVWRGRSAIGSRRRQTYRTEPGEPQASQLRWSGS